MTVIYSNRSKPGLIFSLSSCEMFPNGVAVYSGTEAENSEAQNVGTSVLNSDVLTGQVVTRSEFDALKAQVLHSVELHSKSIQRIAKLEQEIKGLHAVWDTCSIACLDNTKAIAKLEERVDKSMPLIYEKHHTLQGFVEKLYDRINTLTALFETTVGNPSMSVAKLENKVEAGRVAVIALSEMVVRLTKRAQFELMNRPGSPVFDAAHYQNPKDSLQAVQNAASQVMQAADKVVGVPDFLTNGEKFAKTYRHLHGCSEGIVLGPKGDCSCVMEDDKPVNAQPKTLTNEQFLRGVSYTGKADYNTHDPAKVTFEFTITRQELDEWVSRINTFFNGEKS